MSYENIQANTLIKLADSHLNKEIAENGGEELLPAVIRDKMKIIIKKRQEESAEAAAESVVGLSEAANGAIGSLVEGIREHRAMIAKQKATIAKINRARVYGYETLNFIPLMKLLGISLPVYVSSNPGLSVVPENWEPSVSKPIDHDKDVEPDTPASNSDTLSVE